MGRKSELESEISNIWKIFINANECFHYSFYLHNPNTQEEFDYLINSIDLQYIGHAMWRMTIIELSKLFSGSKTRRDRYNIQHLICKLKNDGIFRNIGFSNETIKKWETKIERNQETINSILILRDKIYAHTDSEVEKFLDIDLPFKQIQFLLEIVKEIIQDVHFSVFNSEAIVETVVFNKERFGIIKVLAEAEKNRIQRLCN